ncbi:MAG: PilZ domain-containing protein [Pseudomonadota bacterium]
MKMEGDSTTILSDGRLAKRLSCEQFGDEATMTLEIRNLSLDSMEARLLNISETGMGISTNGELELGQMVNVASNPQKNMPKKAVVMWSCREPQGYRAGLKFVRSS